MTLTPSTQHRRPHILVVYDSRAIRETVSILGIADDFDVDELDDASELEQTLSRCEPDLVLLCAISASTTAYDVCRRVKSFFDGVFVPVAVYSLSEDADQLADAYEAGVDSVIQVTISPEAMLYRVRSLLRIRDEILEMLQKSRNLAQATHEAAVTIDEMQKAQELIHTQNKQLMERDVQIRQQQEEITRQMQEMRYELDLAASVQSAMLPQLSTTPPQIQIEGRYIPAARLGGDYYDFLRLDRNRVFLCIADVSGHGVAPALVGMQARTLARGLVESGMMPSLVLREVNSFLYRSFRHAYFMTMWAMVFDVSTGLVQYAGAGHCPAIVTDCEKQDWQEYASQGVPLGVMPEAVYPEGRFTLKRGQRILLYSDGITEAKSADGKLFGPGRLQENLSAGGHLSCERLLDALLKQVHTFSGASTFQDDVTLLLLSFDKASAMPEVPSPKKSSRASTRISKKSSKSSSSSTSTRKRSGTNTAKRKREA